MAAELSPVTSNDIQDFLAINNLAVPHVNELDDASLGELLDQAWWCHQFRDADRMQAFLLVLKKGQSYQSLNYQWFSERYENFAYVDRIVVSEQNRGAGLAGKLYEALFDAARASGLNRVCCEVNVEPANPVSLAFHHRLGFNPVGEQETDSGAKKVSLLIKELDIT